MLLAAELPVERVIGVEIAAELAATARRNLERYHRRVRAGDVQIVTSDVLAWPVPADLTVVYLYNPFFGDPFKRVIERLVVSCDERPRPLRLVYRYPWEHNWLLSTGRFRVLDVSCGDWPPRRRWWLRDDVIVTYGVVAEGIRHRRVRRPTLPALRHWAGPNHTRFFVERSGRPTVWSS